MSFSMSKPLRTSHFNFKDPQGQQKFFNMTNMNPKLSKIFSTKDAFTTEDTYAERVFETIGDITGEDGKVNNMGV